MKKKLNCWEFKNCGRKGECPATTDPTLNEVHGGLNAGRACWVVAGTFCGGKVSGTFVEKYANCSECDFYKSVWTEEGGKFVLVPKLVKMMRGQ